MEGSFESDAVEASGTGGTPTEHLQRQTSDRKASSREAADHKPIVVGSVGLDRGDVEFLKQGLGPGPAR